MNEDLNTTLKVIAALATIGAANAGMTLFAAPGHTGSAVAAGVLLTAFGFAFAKYSMDIVMLPIAVLAFIFRILVGRKDKSKPNNGSDRIDTFGRALFVVSYGFISGIFGIYVGSLEGGMGWFLSAAMFGAVGIVLALLVPMDLVWAAEGSDTATGELSEAGTADLEQARRDGVPAVVFADKVAKSIVKAVTDSNGPNAKR